MLPHAIRWVELSVQLSELRTNRFVTVPHACKRRDSSVPVKPSTEMTITISKDFIFASSFINIRQLA